MNKCKKNILLIFGYLLFVAILVIPYSESWIMTKNGAASIRKDGWFFWPITLSKRNFIINWSALTTEIAVILFAAGFAYIIFCIVLKKGNK